MDKVLVLGLFDNGEEENLLKNVKTTLFAQHDAKVNGQLLEHVNL